MIYSTSLILLSIKAFMYIFKAHNNYGIVAWIDSKHKYWTTKGIVRYIKLNLPASHEMCLVDIE